MKYSAAVITISDKGFRGERQDTGDRRCVPYWKRTDGMSATVLSWQMRQTKFKNSFFDAVMNWV